MITDALDRLALLFCISGVAMLMLMVLAVVLLWAACESERSRLRGRPPYVPPYIPIAAAGHPSPPAEHSLPTG